MLAWRERCLMVSSGIGNDAHEIEMAWHVDISEIKDEECSQVTLFAQMFFFFMNTLPLNHCLEKVPLWVEEGVKACAIYLGRHGSIVGWLWVNKVLCAFLFVRQDICAVSFSFLLGSFTFDIHNVENQTFWLFSLFQTTNRSRVRRYDKCTRILQSRSWWG